MENFQPIRQAYPYHPSAPNFVYAAMEMTLKLSIESARRIYERYMQPDYKAMARAKKNLSTNPL